MSTKVSTLVWDLDLPLAQKMMLLALADQANDYGEGYPGVETLRRRCSMGRRTVYEALAALEAEGFVERHQLPGKKTLYALNLDRLRQQDLLKPQAPQRDAYAAGRNAATAGCASRTGAPAARVRLPQGAANDNSGGAPAALIKSNQELKATALGNACASRDDQLALLPKFDQQLIAPHLDKLPAGILLTTWAAFVKHRQVCGRVLSISSYTYLLKDLAELASAGVDLDQSLCLAMKLGLSGPADPRKKTHRGRGPPRPRINDDFSEATYASTPDDELPPELRADATA